jgi:UDP-N-acetylglucosamine--N-acetylmuramyl-(pentapeptide) pyrophosphoryl-undecaprenol N-acetylglucosamine transferase
VHDRPVVVVSGGGTGGHLYPALAIADALRERRSDVRVVFVGARRGIEARILPARGEEHLLLPVEGFDRARPLSGLRVLSGLAVGLVRTARLFARLRPEVVVVTGGYAGAAAGIVAGLAGVPLVLQEQNAEPGMVTRLLTRWAARVHVAYPEAIARLPLVGERARVTGNPVRVGSGRARDAVRAELGVPAGATLLLITGGSQGSLALNRVVGEALRALAKETLHRPEGLHLLWVSGPSHLGSVEALVRECGAPAWVRTVGYVDDMPSVLAAADLAVSRAGAMFTAELLERGVPAVLVPLPTAAAGHQMYNARALESAGAAVVLPQDELTGEGLWSELDRLLAAPDTLARMSAAARAHARPGGASDIAADVEAFMAPAGRGA